MFRWFSCLKLGNNLCDLRDVSHRFVILHFRILGKSFVRLLLPRATADPIPNEWGGCALTNWWIAWEVCFDIVIGLLLRVLPPLTSTKYNFPPLGYPSGSWICIQDFANDNPPWGVCDFALERPLLPCLGPKQSTEEGGVQDLKHSTTICSGNVFPLAHTSEFARMPFLPLFPLHCGVVGFLLLVQSQNMQCLLCPFDS